METTNPLMQASKRMPVMSRITPLVNNADVITFVPEAVIDRDHITRVPVQSYWKPKHSPLIEVHVHFVPFPPSPAKPSDHKNIYTYAVHICLFFLYCRSSLDNSSDKFTAEYGGKKKSGLGKVNRERSRWILPLLSHYRAAFLIMMPAKWHNSQMNI